MSTLKPPNFKRREGGISLPRRMVINKKQTGWRNRTSPLHNHHGNSQCRQKSPVDAETFKTVGNRTSRTSKYLPSLQVTCQFQRGSWSLTMENWGEQIFTSDYTSPPPVPGQSGIVRLQREMLRRMQYHLRSPLSKTADLIRAMGKPWNRFCGRTVCKAKTLLKSQYCERRRRLDIIPD